MALAFGSLQSTDVANGGASPNLTITKPSGLADGDLMVAFLGTTESINAYTASGWTQIKNISDGDFSGTNDGVFTCLAKIADSSDAAASDFTFSQTGGDGGQGTLIRVTASEGDFDLSSLLVSTSDFDEDGLPFTGSGITPASPNNFLLFSLFQGGADNASGYAIATDNPTWTERTDRTNAGNVDTAQQVATASRSEGTATGNYTATIGGQETFGMLLAVNESISVTVNVGTLTAASSLQATTQSGAANVSAGVMSAASSLQGVTLSTFEATQWTLESDPNTGWTNEPLI